MTEPQPNDYANENEAAAAPTATAPQSENLVDQNQESDSDEIVTSHPFESNLGGAAEPVAPEREAGIASGSPDSKVLASNPADQENEWEKVDEGEMPFAKRGPGRPQKIITAEAAGDKIVKLPLDKLLPHPLNEKLYGPTSPEEIGNLTASIAEVGQISPIIVTADLEKVGYYTIISGHKRADALRSLGRTEANCQLEDVKDADERLLRLLEANRQHVPTTEQKIRIGEVYLGFETKKAKARQVAGAKAAKKDGEGVEVFTQPLPSPTKTGDDTAGKARDLAAAKVGMSGVSLERGLKILKVADQAEQDGKKETAAELRRILNEKGVDPAYSHAKSLHLIQQTTKKKVTGGEMKAETVPKPGANAPQNLAPASNGHKTDDGVPPTVLLLADVGDAETVSQPTKRNAQRPSLAGATVDALKTDDPPLAVSIITACNKLADDLEELDPAELTNDQKWNLTRAFDNLMERIASHEQALELPGQL